MGSISLSEKRLVITGGARGLGRAFVEAAIKAGARVVVADILEDVGRQTVKKLSRLGEVYFESVDLGDPGSIAALSERSINQLGGVDGLVNCAAIATGIGGKTADEIDVETWDRVMTVNVRGTWLAVRAFSPALRAAGNGKIVNIASDTAMWGAPRLLHYVASKGAVISMTRALARELGNDGIAVNAIAPGLTLVEATEYVPKERHRQYVDGRAMNREQQPEDVTGTVLYLLSDAADFVTGQLLPVNGGFIFN
ncbi:MAG: SDR family oxidoreductase [Pseudomonadota bacterium]|nr:SDR family oxidoreductase [Pseudomonadota bacterium]MEC8289786.1 SDR family oxidoreductase [Pseudomonadota bacterium]MEC8530665.1 SDR family oxidoreductase [Pseudomonadota bacterium]